MCMKHSLTLDTPLDMHLHLRDGDMLSLVGPYTSNQFAGAVVMPNLTPPAVTPQEVSAYRLRVTSACGEAFAPLMTSFFRPSTEQELLELKPHIFGMKLYPAGVTTNSEGGLACMDDALATLEMMQEMDIPLLVHGETCGFVLDRERDFLPTYKALANKFPKLKIVMEHLSCAEALDLLGQHQNLYATVTVHHLVFTLDDVLGGNMRTHLFCKPILKHNRDREALLDAVLGGHPKIMFGSDSAPHAVESKLSGHAPGGIFSAPVALPTLAELFDRHGVLDGLQHFVSDCARNLYGLDMSRKLVKLEQTPMQVPEVITCEATGMCVEPLYAGQELPWSICDDSAETASSTHDDTTEA